MQSEKRTNAKVNGNVRTVNEQMRRTDAITALAEGQSIASFKRVRLAQCFEYTPDTRPARRKKQSPKFEGVSWDKEKLLTVYSK